MTPVAVADLDPARLKVARQDRPEIETYRSMTEMLRKSDVDLITIITPHNTHAKLVITGEWARRPIHILDLAGRSAKLRRAIKAKYK